jgi:dienelactone hydrolase
MKKLAAALLAAGLLVGLGLHSRAFQGLLLRAYLPAFPQPSDVVSELRADSAGPIHFRTASPFDLDVVLASMEQATPTTGLGYLTLPEQASARHRVPALILLPGSGGITPGREHEYADLLKSLGIATFVIEYYRPRGMTEDHPYLVRTATVTEFDVLTDAYSALKLLSTSERIDPARIGLMGFSYGGMAARFALDERLREALAPALPGFALHVDFYGPCFQKLGSTRARNAPLLTVRGTDDGSNDLVACSAREKELEALGVDVEAHVLPGVGHAFENTAPRRMTESPYVRGCEVVYDERGFPFLDGERITRVAPGASRFERIAARLTSGGAYRDCVKYGYLVGRDEAASRKAREILIGFLARVFGPAGS